MADGKCAHEGRVGDYGATMKVIHGTMHNLKSWMAPRPVYLNVQFIFLIK